MTDEKDTPLPQAALEWWQQLQEDPGGRAALRRCARVGDVAFVPAFHRLRWTAGKVRTETVAIIAAVLAHVKTNATNGKVAEQMARGKGERAVVSNLRFRRLLERSDTSPDELAMDLIRIIRLLDGAVNIKDLVDGIRRWGHRDIPVQMAWASAYFDAAPKER